MCAPHPPSSVHCPTCHASIQASTWPSATNTLALLARDSQLPINAERPPPNCRPFASHTHTLPSNGGQTRAGCEQDAETPAGISGAKAQRFGENCPMDICKTSRKRKISPLNDGKSDGAKAWFLPAARYEHAGLQVHILSFLGKGSKKHLGDRLRLQQGLLRPLSSSESSEAV